MLNIKNDFLSVDIAIIGAEVRKVTSADGSVDYMWNGNPQVWAGVSPVLFPIVGKLKDDTLRFAGKEYNLTKHGYARYSEFKILAQSQSSVTLFIEDQKHPNDMTYPFNFKFSVTYSLVGRRLTTQFNVKNLSPEIAYFSVGAHPAFNCPFDDVHKITDYRVEFPDDEELTLHRLTPDGLFAGTSKIKLTNCSIQLEPHIFDNDALFFSGFKSNEVSLIEKDSNKKITVSTKGFPYLGLWAKPGAAYICIEPWCGSGDRDGFGGEINTKADILPLNGDSSWSNSYTIDFAY